MMTGYGFETTGDEILEGIDLSGKRIIVTGSTSGIGAETVRALAKAGAEVTMAVRNVEVGRKVADEIMQATGNRKVTVQQLELSDFASVRSFVSNWNEPLDVLINNAGVMGIPYLQKISEGIEMQFMTNYLGHFALSVGLHKFLKAAPAARIVMVSSSGHLLCPVLFDDINFNFISYDPWLSYGQSKTACILFAVGAARRWREDGIAVNALNPGAILTNLQRHVGGKLRSAPEFHKTVQEGAATSILLSASPVVRNVSGAYFEDCNEAEVVTSRPERFAGVAKYALDPDGADRLWDLSTSMIEQLQKKA
ncbi:SDR family NAD(P)-dependent oxidoreductase [Dyadobacter sp. CY261]|uniref:SDR family NAD(P)-dependent oxidoreductase n=1 Tax=Dyadobacter sp. CY261 TaxID=2907203 RepID=UPI001F44FBEB|nr:SDR family NAD(P)-dependent oxidoreductase [Dyadobacter sp. CY261]MCF0074231.1 SDR family NAD(P)-dependent oxidoreductase [Dyadobacter sp. CY261]